MYKVTAILGTVLCTLMLSACSTVEGVGKDIQQVGSSIEQEAKEEKAQN
jgi:predicted small secreted protein